MTGPDSWRPGGYAYGAAGGGDTDASFDPRPPTGPGPDTGASATLWVLRLARVVVFFVYAVVTACLVLLALAFVMRLFGASTDAEFTRWVYRNVDRLMEPFRGMFPSPAVTDRSVVDFSLLFAMIIYAIAAIGLHALVSWLADRVVAVSRRDRQRTVATAPPTRSPARPRPPTTPRPAGP